MDELKKQIDELRFRIDAIDREIVAKLNERAMQVLEIKSAKEEAGMDLLDPQREEDIFSNISMSNDGPMYDDSLRAIFESILKEMKALESR